MSLTHCYRSMAAVYLAELKKHAPEMYSICEQAIASESKDLDFIRIDPEIFATCPDDSIDYAVMEKTALAAMVPLDAGWSDVGSWSSLWETADNKDENGNMRTLKRTSERPERPDRAYA